MNDMDLHVWCYADCDFVIASDRDDAESALVSASGIGIGAGGLYDWKQCDDTDEFSISFTYGVISRDTMCEPIDARAIPIRRTFGEWVRAFGPGYLCTTEF